MFIFSVMFGDSGNEDKLDILLFAFAKIEANVVNVYVSFEVIFSFSISFLMLLISPIKLYSALLYESSVSFLSILYPLRMFINISETIASTAKYIIPTFFSPSFFLIFITSFSNFSISSPLQTHAFQLLLLFEVRKAI